MGGFLDNLSTLLGGFSDVRQIDQDGFDFREKRKAAQFERDRRVEEARQADEDRAVGQIADVLSSQETPDMSVAESALPAEMDAARRKFTIQRALGQLPERKSRLEATKAYARIAQEQARGENRLQAIAATGDEAQELENLRAKNRANAPLTSYEQARLDLLEKGINIRGQRQAQGTLVPLTDDVGNIRGFYNNKTGEFQPAGEGIAGLRRGPLGVGAQEALTQGTGALAAIQSLKSLLQKKPEGVEWTGPTAATEYTLRSGQAPRPIAIAAEQFGLEPPAGEQALFLSQLGGLKNAGIKAITGAQMSEREVPRLMQELPTETDRGEVLWAKIAVTEARFNLLDQVRRGELTKDQAIRQINAMGPEQYLQQYREQGLTGGRVPAAGGSRYKKTRVE